MTSLPSLTLIRPDPLPEKCIEKMFDKMLLDYGKKFIDQWQGVDTDKLVKHWAQQMADFTGHEISTGLAALDGSGWPPSLPEFKKMCRPSTDPLVAYYEAAAGIEARKKGEIGKWSHPAIYHAAMPIAFDLSTQTYSQMKGRWEQALAEQMGRGEWAEILKPVLALAAPDKSPQARANATKAMSDLGAAGILKPKTDHKLWAKRIIKREEEGDKTISALQIKMAREAVAL